MVALAVIDDQDAHYGAAFNSRRIVPRCVCEDFINVGDTDCLRCGRKLKVKRYLEQWVPELPESSRRSLRRLLEQKDYAQVGGKRQPLQRPWRVSRKPIAPVVVKWL